MGVTRNNHKTLAERSATYTGRERYRLEGLIRAVMQAKACTLQAAAAYLAEMEAAGDTTIETYRQLQAWLPGQTVVDKTPSYTFDPNILTRIETCFDQPLYVHLLRHPKAALHSFEDTS